MDAWTKIGAIAAVVAAVAGLGALGVGWFYGRRTDTDARRALKYERLREARDLLSLIRTNGDNARFPQCNDAAARLRALLPLLDQPLPATQRVVEVAWDLTNYGPDNFYERVNAAQSEVDQAVEALGTQ